MIPLYFGQHLDYTLFHHKAKVLNFFRIILIFLLTLNRAYALYSLTDSVRIGLFTGSFPSKITFTALSHGYELNGTPLALNESVGMVLLGDSLIISTTSGFKHRAKTILFQGPLYSGKFKLLIDKEAERHYYGSLELKVIRGVVRIVNTTPFQRYLAGVVDAETGPKGSLEFYKVQAIIARTFTLENLEKHADFGFNLCDAVHCQVFKGTATRNSQINVAVERTNQQVLYEADGKMAFAPYHSNCGGQTESSDNVWGGNRYYLKRITDTFCVHQSKARWESRVPIEKWNKWLLRNHVADMVNQSFTHNADARQRQLTIGKTPISCRKIRTDFNLSSAFFSVRTTPSEVIFNGRGYGHGVGVCQQGAMRMAELGYRCEDILSHYYKGLHIGKVAY